MLLLFILLLQLTKKKKLICSTRGRFLKCNVLFLANPIGTSDYHKLDKVRYKIA